MTTPLRFAIVGCGKIANRHAIEIKKHGTLAAVCDVVKERADQFAQMFEANKYYDIDSLLHQENNIDVLAVCTPNGLHAAQSMAALKAGCNVLCEKPLAIATTDAKKMMQAAIDNNKKLFVVKSTRYNPALLSLKKIIQEKKLGELYSFQLNCFWNRPAAYYANTWKGSADLDGGTLYTQFSHYIDAMLWLFGEVETLSGFRNNAAHKNIIAFEDNGVVALKMKTGMLGAINWSVNSYQKNMEVSLSLLAEKGSICIAGEYMNEVKYQVTEGIQLDVSAGASANDYGFYKGSMSNHDKIYDNLIKALNNEDHPFSNATDGLKTVEFIERVYNSVSLQ